MLEITKYSKFHIYLVERVGPLDRFHKILKIFGKGLKD